MIDERTKFRDFFSEKELVFYKNINDLADKLLKYSYDDKLRVKIAKRGRDKYFRYFNSTLVAQFIIEKTLGLKDTKNYLWHN